MVMALTLLGRRRGTGAARVYARNVTVYKTKWPLLTSGLFEPIFYLGSIGVGFGKLIGAIHTAAGPVSYAHFVAPALLSVSAMNGAIYDSTFNVFYKLKFMKLYDAVLSTPIVSSDIAIGEVMWSLTRGLIYSATFLIVMAAGGLIESWGALLALPASVLVGFAFGGLGLAGTSYVRSWQDFDFLLLATMPMFLFSATFYPLASYPSVIRVIVQCTPLYNGNALMRSLTLGGLSWASLGHVVYLLVAGVIGIAIAGRRFEQRLLT